MTALQKSAPAAPVETPGDEAADQTRFRFFKIALGRPHRYRRYRLTTMSLTLAVLLGVPLAGLARVDLWGGAHRMLGEPVDLGLGLGTVSVAIAAFYGATFLINMVAGRIFCGFGCPVGQLSRLSDAIDALAAELAGLAVLRQAAIARTELLVGREGEAYC